MGRESQFILPSENGKRTKKTAASQTPRAGGFFSLEAGTVTTLAADKPYVGHQPWQQRDQCM